MFLFFFPPPISFPKNIPNIIVLKHTFSLPLVYAQAVKIWVHSWMVEMESRATANTSGGGGEKKDGQFNPAKFITIFGELWLTFMKMWVIEKIVDKYWRRTMFNIDVWTSGRCYSGPQGMDKFNFSLWKEMGRTEVL